MKNLKNLIQNIKFKAIQLFVRIKASGQNKALILGLLFVILMILIIANLISLSSKKEEAQHLARFNAQVQAERMNQEAATQKVLQDINAQIQQIQSGQNNDATQQSLAQITQQLSSINQQNAAAAQSTGAKIDAIQDMQAKEEINNDVLQKQLRQIDKAVTPKQYLSPSVLPFKVQGLSFWNGRPMVTISLPGVNGASYYKLMGQGEAFDCGVANSSDADCETWSVETINTDNNSIIFKNQDGKEVRVSL